MEGHNKKYHLKDEMAFENDDQRGILGSLGKGDLTARLFSGNPEMEEFSILGIDDAPILTNEPAEDFYHAVMIIFIPHVISSFRAKNTCARR